ncbi:MAG: hypothetical protein ABIG68_06710 [Acidobacteriota bacterium]
MGEEHLTSTQLERFRRRVMAPAELIAADKHLAGCLLCRDAAWREEPGTASVDSLQAALCGAKTGGPAHLSYEQLAALVDGSLDQVEREIAESHTAVCGDCRADLLDLGGFRKSLSYPLRRRRAAGSVMSWWRNTAGFFDRKVKWTPVWAAAAVATVGLLIWVGSIPFHGDLAHPPGETSQSAGQTPTQVAGEERLPGTGTNPANVEIAMLNEGGSRVALLADGSLAGLPGAPPDMRDSVKEVLSGGRLALPDDVTELVVRPGILLSGDQQREAFHLRSPVGTAVVTDRPTFRWQPMPGAQRYEVSVYDDNYTQVLESPPVKGAEWSAPRPMEGGRVYSWQVKAYKNGEEVLSPKPPAPEAKFKVLDRQQAGELARAQRDHAGSHLILGILFARAGALDDARRELIALEEANPQSPIPQRLLRQIEALRR